MRFRWLLPHDGTRTQTAAPSCRLPRPRGQGCHVQVRHKRPGRHHPEGVSVRRLLGRGLRGPGPGPGLRSDTNQIDALVLLYRTRTLASEVSAEEMTKRNSFWAVTSRAFLTNLDMAPKPAGTEPWLVLERTVVICR